MKNKKQCPIFQRSFGLYTLQFNQGFSLFVTHIVGVLQLDNNMHNINIYFITLFS